MSVGCTRLLLATWARPDRLVVLRGHSPPLIGGRLIHMLRVTVIFAFARSAMPVLHTLVRGVRQLASSICEAQWRRDRKRGSGFVVPIWVGRRCRATRGSAIGNFAAARVKLPLTSRRKQA